jgi:H+-translocating NAD(P) transhydrogenase subunit alpha
MRVGAARETAPGERRVALVPETVGKLAAAGFDVVVEAGAGEAASFPDDAYAEAGATLGSPWDADTVVKVRKPDDAEAARLRDGQLLVGFLDPLGDRAGIERLAELGIVAFAMESVPRITRAQAMDALSSQATVGGYKAALLAAEHLPRFFPMLMTAAGTVPPAKVLVIGAGVAGLQGIATARRLGAVVTGFDVRPAVQEQIESLGANWLDLGVTGAEAEGGYARELTPEEMQAQQQALEGRIGDFDVVITTAAVPGRRAPILTTKKALAAMAPGSVIVDLAAETGGNCELTVTGETVTSPNGVTIVGTVNLPSTVATDASQLYSKNVQTLLEYFIKDAAIVLDMSDEIIAGTTLVHNGEIVHQPTLDALAKGTA